MIEERKNLDSASIYLMTWAEIFIQYRPHEQVRRMQLRIVKAVKERHWGRVRYLSRLLTNSFYAKLLAISKATSNKGKYTPGVDEITWLTDNEKIQAIGQLSRKGYRPKPLRRIYIPKKDKTKLRPLSIPTIRDRAMQALHLLALEPISEALADPNSYGFRKFRSCADAIAKCFNVLCHKYDATWVYEADIKSCFDRISHDWLLANIPMDKAILRKWLKCGYVENYRRYNTEEGTPQGGIISPVLMNMTLDGLEAVIRQKYPPWRKSKVNFIRYADDFVITAPTRERIEHEIAPLVEAFLKERGLQISPEKTRVTKVTEGFNFLSQHLRKYRNGKLLIKPARASVRSFVAKLREVFVRYKGQAAHALIQKLNPLIRGWSNYHRHIVSKRTFWVLSKYIFAKCMKWSKQQHPHKKIHWIWDKYFTRGRHNGHFAVVVTDRRGVTRTFQTYEIGMVPIIRFEKIKSAANPYDTGFDDYFARRIKKKQQSSSKCHQVCIYLHETHKTKRA